MDTPAMESILRKLLYPENEVIVEGTQELQKAFQSATAIPELCSVLGTCQSPEIRQYAAVLLRKKFGKFKSWNKLSFADKNAIKCGCLQALAQDKEKSVKMSIAQLVGILASHELKSSSWPELDKFIQEASVSVDPHDRFVAVYTLTALCETVGHEMTRSMATYSKMFQRGLADENLEIAFYTIRAMTQLVIHMGSDELNYFQPLVSQVLPLIQKLVLHDEEQACQAMEIFDELFESEVAIVVPHIKPIIEMSLKMAAEKQFTTDLRIKAISLLGQLTKLKKKTIIKNKLHIAMINVLFPIMAEVEEDDDDDGEVGDFVGNSLIISVGQVLDTLAINLPADKFMSAILNHVYPSLQSQEPPKMRAAINALAVSVEGCGEFIKSKYLMTFLPIIGNGIQHESLMVRKAALFALGQFSEFLQPDISNYANDIVPVLLTYLDRECFHRIPDPNKNPSGLDRMFYALESFCENLENQLVPFLPELMKRLILLLDEKFSVRIQECGISAISAVASSAEGEIFPYHTEISQRLLPYLRLEGETNVAQILLCQAMSTLGVVTKALGRTQVGFSFAETCCQTGVAVLSKHDDPDIKKCAYSLFASVAFVARDQLEVVIQPLMSYLLHTCSSKDGFTCENPAKDSSILPLDLIDSDEEEQGNDGASCSDTGLQSMNQVPGSNALEIANSQTDNTIKTIQIDNAFIEEKEQAVIAMKEICKYASNSFVPYIQNSFDEVWKLLDFPDEYIRRASIEAVVEFVCALNKHQASGPRLRDVFNACVVSLVPKLQSIVKEDKEVSVVCSCLEEIAHLLRDCGKFAVSVAGHPELIVKCIHMVMKSECKCMDPEVLDETEDPEAMEAEQDEVLFECAGDILPCLGKAMTPDSFSPYFAGLLPHLLKKTKNTCSDSERSFSAGALAECLFPLRGVLEPYLNVLFPIFLSLLKDKNDNVRNNVVFGLGELALHGGSIVYPQYSTILQNLSNMTLIEDCPRVIDQIVGAVCRLIIGKKDLVPLDDVVPVIFNNLPLKEDKDEMVIVFRCITLLHETGYPLVREKLAVILKVLVNYLETTTEINEEMQQVIVELLNTIRTHSGQDFETLSKNFPEEARVKLAQILTSSL